MGVATGFSYGGEMLPPPLTHPPSPPSPSVRLHMWSAGTGSSSLCPLSEGCVLFHINDKERSGSKKSLSYTHLFKKSQPYNTVGGSPQESSESRGAASMTKGRNKPHFLSPETRAAQFQSAVGLSPKPRIPSCISMGVFLHKERSTTA